jgi:hypothetical protein
MKKVFAILTLTAVFAACNSGSDSATVVTDSTATPAAAPAVDSAAAVIDSSNTTVDAVKDSAHTEQH